MIHNFLRKEVKKIHYAFLFFQKPLAHFRLRQNGGPSCQRITKEHNFWPQTCHSRPLNEDWVFFKTKFNFGHECSQYFISYKNLYTPILFLFLHFLNLDFHDFLSFPPFLILSSFFPVVYMVFIHVKNQTFWKGHKIFKQSPTCFDVY